MRFIALTGGNAAGQTVRIEAGVGTASVFTEVVLKAAPHSAEEAATARLPLEAACSPGSMAAIGGIALASGEPAAPVWIDGEAGVTLVSAGGRIVFVCPSRWPSEEMVVTVGAASNVVRVPMREATPGILTVDDVHPGQGMIVAESGELAAQSSAGAKAAPVQPGGLVSVYVTGMGAAARLYPDDAGAGMQDDAGLRSRIQLLIDGRPAEVIFAAALPGLPGIHQVDAIIPPATAPGGRVPVEIRVALTDGTVAVINQAVISIAVQ
jgi:uncharacterized protein (TIGR03437 family)